LVTGAAENHRITARMFLRSEDELLFPSEVEEVRSRRRRGTLIRREYGKTLITSGI
jgi:predicted ATPase